LATVAPDRQSDLAQVAFRAFIAGSTASFMNACVAGKWRLAIYICYIQSLNLIYFIIQVP
jgi:hypothetical protein